LRVLPASGFRRAEVRMGDTVNHERLGQPLLLNADVDEKNSRRRTLTVVWWSPVAAGRPSP